VFAVQKAERDGGHSKGDATMAGVNCRTIWSLYAINVSPYTNCI
jgi:hypothetical protein